MTERDGVRWEGIRRREEVGRNRWEEGSGGAGPGGERYLDIHLVIGGAVD